MTPMLDPYISETIRKDFKHKLVEFMQSRLVKAAEIIRKNASTCIFSNLKEQDTVLIYKSDPLVVSSLVEHFNNVNKYFTVIVIDDMAHPEGCTAYSKLKELQNSPEAFDLQIYYAPISALSSIFKRNYSYTKNIKHVLLGCEGILQNGNVQMLNRNFYSNFTFIFF